MIGNTKNLHCNEWITHINICIFQITKRERVYLESDVAQTWFHLLVPGETLAAKHTALFYCAIVKAGLKSSEIQEGLGSYLCFAVVFV